MMSCLPFRLSMMSLLLVALCVSTAPRDVAAANSSSDGSESKLTPQAVLVISRGKPGSNSSALINEWKQQTSLQQPRFVVLMVGTNDAVNSRALVSVDRYKQNITRMLEHWAKVSTEIQNAEPAVLITIPHINEEPVSKRHPNHPQLGKINAHVDTYNAVLKELAMQYGATLVDLENWTAGLSFDGVHMTPEGYAHIAQRVATAIGQRIKAGDRVLCVGDSLTYGSRAQGSGTTRGESYPAVLNNLLNVQAGLPADARQFALPRKTQSADNLIFNGDFRDTDDGRRPTSWFIHDFQHTVSLLRNDQATSNPSAALLFTPRETPRNSQPSRFMPRTARRPKAGTYRLIIDAQPMSDNAALAVHLRARDRKNQPVVVNAAGLSQDNQDLQWQPVKEQRFEVEIQLPDGVDQTLWQIYVQGTIKIQNVQWQRVENE